MATTAARLAELLASVDSFQSQSDSALRAVHAELVDHAISVRDGEIPVDGDMVGMLTDIADAAESAWAVIDKRVERRSDVERRLGIAPADPEPEPAPEPEPQPVVTPALSTITPPTAQQPKVSGVEPRWQRMRDRTFVDFESIVPEVVEAFENFERDAGTMSATTGPVFQSCGKLDIRDLFTDDRRLDNLNAAPAGYNAKVDALVASAWDARRWTPEALTAAGVPNSLVSSGSFCAPAAPNYEIPVVSQSARPVRDGLPVMQGERGSLVVVQPPRLSDVTSSTAQTAGSAISVWTSAVDLAPGGTTKPFQTVPCPSPITVSEEALVSQLQFGNSMQRAFPELVRAWIELSAAQWARRADGELLRQVDANSTAVTTTTVLGATADFVGYLNQAAAAQRSRHRMAPDARLRVLIPQWFVNFVAADLAHVHAGDGLDRFFVDEAFVRRIFATVNCNVSFYQDQAVAGATTSQIFPAQGPSDLSNFPPTPGVTNARVIWYLYPEGVFSVADGGTLDLGIVRDSVLNGTNDFRMFTESWEAIVPKVIESLKITSTLCATGSGATDASSSAFCTSS